VLRQDQASGEHELEVTDADADLSFNTKTFTIKRDEQVALKAWFERKPAVAANLTPGIDDDAWLKEVAALPAEQQVAAVVARLKERNPGFDGPVDHSIDDGGVVTRLGITGDHARNIRDISPVRALPRLRDFRCDTGYGKSNAKGVLADLSPLKEMNLTELILDGMKVNDLSPLKEMNVRYLAFSRTLVSDLSPLKDMDLEYLFCNNTRVSDLSPLKDMKLRFLWCQNTRVSDLSPLKGMPLKELECDFQPERDAAILRSIKTLETI